MPPPPLCRAGHACSHFVAKLDLLRLDFGPPNLLDGVGRFGLLHLHCVRVAMGMRILDLPRDLRDLGVCILRSAVFMMGVGLLHFLVTRHKEKSREIAAYNDHFQAG